MKVSVTGQRPTSDMKSTLVAVLIFIGILAFACSHPPPGKGAGEIESSPQTHSIFKVETVIPNLQVVWSIVWAPDGRMIFTERPGRVRVYENGKLRPEPLFTVPDVESKGESGLMSVALHPNFASNHWLYLSYAYNSGGQFVRVVRYREAPSGFTDRKVIIENIPAAQFHAGCRLRFGPDGKLYITTGDATDRELAQKLDSIAGKILRLNDDGSVLSDNPFVGQQNARPEIWAYGSRNSQGIDWQPGTNLLWETEHGPSGFDGPGGGDEVNIIERGKNYGWPVIHHRDTHAGMESPVLEYTPACAPASGMFYRGSVFAGFKGNFFFSCLRGERIIRVVTNGRTVVSQENLLEGKYGRIRDIAEGPDGLIYFSTSNRDGRGQPAADDDRILRMAPVSGVR
ncbi:MAG: aldose sugar dehydrogenase [Blastocatellia bacterium]|jgi:glucose/arabinose dehydrogenase|nr:aldose sugar dehydrogenase [Blastocatellia bacterium]